MIKRIIGRYLPERAVGIFYNVKSRISNKDDFNWSGYNKEPLEPPTKSF